MVSKKKEDQTIGERARGGFREATNVTKVFLTLLIALAIVIVVVYFVRWGVQQSWWPSVGIEATSTPINTQGALGKVINFFVGGGGVGLTWEAVLIRLSILMILLVAMADILGMFSTFSTMTSWLIALGLGIIASASGWVKAIAELLGLTAGIGAVGIVLIIFGSLAAAVTLNLGVGGVVRKWRMNRQVEIEAMKTEEGTARVTEAVGALKNVQREFARGEKGGK